MFCLSSFHLLSLRIRFILCIQPVLYWFVFRYDFVLNDVPKWYCNVWHCSLYVMCLVCGTRYSVCLYSAHFIFDKFTVSINFRIENIEKSWRILVDLWLHSYYLNLMLCQTKCNNEPALEHVPILPTYSSCYWTLKTTVNTKH